MNFPLSETVNPPTVFLVRRSQLRGRLDAEYNFALFTTRISSKYPHRKIREIASSRTGGTPSKSRAEYWEGDIPWASPKDFKSFYLTQTEDHISRDAVLDSATSLVPRGTLLVVFRSGILQHSLPVTITTRETAINQDLKALLLDGDVVAEYVGAYFVVFGKRLLPLITKSGATVQSINTEQFEQLDIPIPPEKVQGAVVANLLGAYKTKLEKEDRARNLLAGIDDVLLDELGMQRKTEPPDTIENRVFYSRFPQLTGARWDPLFHQGDIFHFLREAKGALLNLGELAVYFLTGFAAGRGDQSGKEGGIVQIRPTNLSDDRELVFHRNVYISPTELKKRPLDVLQRCEVLFNNTNSQEQVGKTAYFDLAGDYFCSNHITRIATDAGQLDPQFLGYVLNLYRRQKVFFRLCTNWNNQSGVGVDVLKKIPIPLPDPKRQKQIVRRLEKIRIDAGELRREAASELEEAKKSIEGLILGKEAWG